MSKDNKVSIGICIVTYNQENFISQCIESVLCQQTNYDFKIYIGEDCSTDKTTQICRTYFQNYPNRITLIQNSTNLGLVKNTINVLERIKEDGHKYVAMLDGDDYWIDDTKLQKQCSFLEENNDYGLVYTHSACLLNRKIYYKKNELLDGKIAISKMKITPIPNNTVMFCTSLLNLIDLNQFIERGFMSCDYAMYVHFAHFVKIKGLDCFTAIVRRGHSSVSHSRDMNKRINYIENDVAQFKYLSDHFTTEAIFTKQDEINHRDYMTYNIAVKYGDYKLAAQKLAGNPFVKKAKKSLFYKVKIFFSSNSFLFYIWVIMSKLYKKIDLRLFE